MNLTTQLGRKVTFPTRIIYFDKIASDLNVSKIRNKLS